MFTTFDGMVRPVEQIEQEIATLNQAVEAIAQEFHDTYSQYLVALSKSVRQQLILASYHLCTHGYPERFLDLSLPQRQDLQQSLRHLAKQIGKRLAEQLQPVQSMRIFSLAELEAGDRFEDRDFGDLDPEASDPETLDPETEDLAASPDQVMPSSDLPLTPKMLVRWQENLEQSITEQLQDLSHAANRLLQQVEVLPSRLPEPVLEVASKSDLISETAGGPPNLLNLLIESDAEEDTAITQVTTIRLRLAEIEFSDSAVAVWRSKIRSLSAQLNRLTREYQKQQKEKAIAQAEFAWRSSWYED